MKELQLVGYTADLLHLVFTDAGESGGRFKAPIDEDFVATLTEVRQLGDPDANPLAALLSDEQPRAQSPDPATSAFAPDAPSDAPSPNGEAPPDGQPSPDGERALRGEGPLAGMAAAARAAMDEEAGAVASDRPRPSSLAPREIQSLLRAGQGIRAVAKQADTDEWWVRRWLPPIEAEREQVLQAVWSSFVAKSRLGVSAEPIAEAVERNLASKGVGPDDPSVEWTAARREGDPHWQVTLRYRSRGRAQRATWHFNPETGALDPRNDLAVDIAWTRTRKRVPGTVSAARSGNRRAAGRKAASGKKGAARKKARRGKKARGKKAAAKKSTAKKAAAKKSAAKKAAAKKSTAKQGTAKKSAAKKAAAKKSTAKQGTAKKSTAKKSTAKKSTAKKSPAKKSTAKKSAAKKGTAKKSTAKKSAAKKSTAKKSAAAESAAKKPPAKKSTAKKSAAKKSAGKKSTAGDAARQ